MLNLPDAPPRRHLTERGAAVALTLGMLAVPGVPLLLNGVLPQHDWDTATPGDAVRVTTRDASFAIAVPAGWQSRSAGDGVILRNGSSTVAIQAYDVDDRNTDDVEQRIMRSTRIGGITAAYDGGTTATADGALTGRTCVAISSDMTGPCAYLTDGQVLLTVTSLGTPEQPAAALDDFVAPLKKERP